MDAPLRARYWQANSDGARLRFVGRFEADAAGRIIAGVGLRALPADYALCGGRGTDQRVANSSDRHRQQPLVCQGSRAGATPEERRVGPGRVTTIKARWSEFPVYKQQPNQYKLHPKL